MKKTDFLIRPGEWLADRWWPKEPKGSEAILVVTIVVILALAFCAAIAQVPGLVAQAMNAPTATPTTAPTPTKVVLPTTAATAAPTRAPTRAPTIASTTTLPLPPRTATVAAAKADVIRQELARKCQVPPGGTSVEQWIAQRGDMPAMLRAIGEMPSRCK